MSKKDQVQEETKVLKEEKEDLRETENKEELKEEETAVPKEEKAPAKKETGLRETLKEARIRGSRHFNERGRNGRTVTIDGADKRRRYMGERTKAATELLNSRTQNRPLKSVVTGIEPMPIDGERIRVASCNYHGWKVFIRPMDFFEKEHTIEEILGNLQSYNIMTDRRLGSEVEFIPLKFITDKYLVIGSRTNAMRERRKEMWFATNDTGRNKETMFLNEGSRVEARVVAVSRPGITIEIFGAETFIPLRELSYGRQQHAGNMFKVGDRVFVRLLKVNRNYDSQEVNFEASVKQAERDPRIDAFGRYVEGGTYRGVVTMLKHDLDKDTKSGAFVRLDGIDVLCNYPRGVSPEIGDTVTIGITAKNEKELLIWGNIYHIDHRNILY